MNPAWHVRTARLDLWPVGWGDLSALIAIKGDPGVFAVMLGGVRGPARVTEELAAEISAWAALGYGVWAVRDIGGGAFRGLTGLQARPDGRGVALRFARVRGYRDDKGAGDADTIESVRSLLA